MDTRYAKFNILGVLSIFCKLFNGGEQMEFETYLAAIDKLNTETKENNKFVINVIKLNYEIELNCLKQANRTFEIILNFRTPVAAGWNHLVRAAFMLGKIEELFSKYINWKEYLAGLDAEADYNYLFLQYCNYKKSHEAAAINLEKLIKKSDIGNELKSNVCFLLGISAETEEEKIKYLQIGNLCCKNNYSVIHELIKCGITPEDIKISDLLRNNINCIENLKYSPVITAAEHGNVSKENKSGAEFKLCVLGGGNTIGGSCYLLKFNGINILVDAGARFGKNNELVYPDFSILNKFGLSFEDIDAFLLTHAHLDHAGGIAELYKRNSKLPMFMTRATKELVYVNLCACTNENICDDKYYLEKCLDSSATVEFREPFIFKKNSTELKIEFFRAGHILGAAAVYLESSGTGVFVTGDYCLDNQKTVAGMDIPDGYKIDYLITENTYGNFNSSRLYPRKIEEKLFINDISRELTNGKIALIPAFALGRSQELIILLKEYFANIKEIPFRVYIDGLVTKVCSIYEKYIDDNFAGGGILYANNNQCYKTKQDFIDNELLYHKCCIIASSGMLQNGSAASFYAERLIENENALCVITGYQDEESVGGRLKNQIGTNTDKYLQINGNLYNVKFNLKEYYLSAHCQLEDIIELIFKIRPAKVFLVHGNAKENEPSELYKMLLQLQNLDVVQTFDESSY